MFKANITNSGQQELLPSCFCDNVSPNINKLWLLLCYLRVPFQLASPPGFHFNTCFFGPSAFFSLSTAGLSSCSRLRGTQGARPGPARKFGPWSRSVARALGFKVASPLGDSEHVEPSRCMQTHVHNTLRG